MNISPSALLKTHSNIQFRNNNAQRQLGVNSQNRTEIYMNKCNVNTIKFVKVANDTYIAFDTMAQLIVKGQLVTIVTKRGEKHMTTIDCLNHAGVNL